MEEPATLREAVERWRMSQGWTKARLAGSIGMATSHYSEFTYGKRNLGYRYVHRLYKVGVPADILVKYPEEVGRE